MSSSTARTEKGQEHDRLAPYPRRRASVGSRLRPWAGAAGWGGRTGRRQGRRTGRPTTMKTMVHAWRETSSWTCNIHCVSRCWGWCRTNTGSRRLLLRPLMRMGWRGGGGMRGERKEVEWQTRWSQLRRGPSLSCGGIDGQMARVWQAGQRHDPFNSAWANPAWASCEAWVVASAHSAGPTRHDYYFYFTKNHIYICTIYIQYYKHLSMTFYWLDSFAQCLPSGCGFNPTSYNAF
jgi:hypothetical protein